MAPTRSRRKQPARGGLSLTASALGLALAVTGGVLSARAALERPGVPTVGSEQVPPFVAAPAVRLEPVGSTPRTPAVKAHPSRGTPVRVVVPALGIDAPVVDADAPGGVLQPPADPQVLGWWSAGAVPGAARGSALVTGHTVSTGGGALDDLELVRPGARVKVRTGRGEIAYVVASVRTYRKASLAADAQRVFSQSVPGRLVLITCEDWNGSVWLSNVVVTAHPVR